MQSEGFAIKNKGMYVESHRQLIGVIRDAVCDCGAGLELGLNTSVKACPAKQALVVNHFNDRM